MMIEPIEGATPDADDKLSGVQGEVGNRSIRERLAQLIHESGEGYAAISRLLGRNPAYVQQFIRRGVPRRLTEDDRRRLAGHFGVDEQLLGGPPARKLAPASSVPAQAVAIPFLRADRAATLLIDRHLIDRLHSDFNALIALDMDGDSMAPTLVAGDSILIDRADCHIPRDGIYVIGSDRGPLVKRLSVHPVTRRVAILADNPAYPNFPDCDPEAISLIGRVVWVGRSL